MENIWQVIILMVAGTICLTAAVKLVSSSILDEIDKFRAKQTARTIQSMATVINGLPEIMSKVMDIQNKKQEEQNRNEMAMKEAFEQMKRTLNKN